MDDSLGMSGSLKNAHLLADGSVEHLGLVGDLSKFSDDAMAGAGEIFATALHALHLDRDGNVKGAHHLGSGLVTTAGVNLLAADWTNATATLKLSNFADSGTGATAAAVTDTALLTATGNARVAGTQSNPSAGVYRTVATLSYTATAAITEWGLFTALAAGPTMWDHKVFAAINVLAGDSIAFTYSLPVAAGG